jgi:hypothetical protein
MQEVWKKDNMILPRVNNSTTDSNKGGMDETQKN